jgi:hypothetical protein
MTLGELAALVGRCRAKQKEYFRTRDATVLRECKDLERRVDAAVEEAERTPGLFDSPDATDIPDSPPNPHTGV